MTAYILNSQEKKGFKHIRLIACGMGKESGDTREWQKQNKSIAL